MRVNITEVDLFISYLSDSLNADNLSLVEGITTDSRDIQKNDLFLAIKGENFDGSDFIDEALSNGAIYVITESVHDSSNVFTVDNVIEFIGEICSKWMADFDGKTIAITGSNGKTTSKELIHLVLKEKFNTIYVRSGWFLSTNSCYVRYRRCDGICKTKRCKDW